ncbi:MAG: hypothetical protein L6R39_000031 [Caloplaca ligustica]|nr:MAG: hypothetical protein L6R39_000031 [Caloplaca ligustica]
MPRGEILCAEWRYQGRYYSFFHQEKCHFVSVHVSSADALGHVLARAIPTTPDGYRDWLLAKRKFAEGLNKKLQGFLSYREDDSKRRESLNGEGWIPTDGVPIFWPSYCDHRIRQLYTIDLDNEVFTVDYGAHFRLNKIPADWAGTIAPDKNWNWFVEPHRVPEGAIADVVSRRLDLEHHQVVSGVVRAKGIAAFPPAQSHGFWSRAKLFELFQDDFTHILSTVLLSWAPGDFPFREISFTILCLAFSSSIGFIPNERVSDRNGLGCARLLDEAGRYTEFVTYLASGAHLEGLTPGSSPESDIYWFGGALVFLIAQLEKQHEAAIARVLEYCRRNYPSLTVNAVCLSIEHLMLIKIYPGGQVERTDVLPLFDIPNHLSMDATARYVPEYLERYPSYLPDITEEDDNRIYKRYNAKPTDHTQTTFSILATFLEKVFRQQIPHSMGIFPTNIYRTITHFADLETRRVLMDVSGPLRDLCLQDLMIMDGVVLKAITPTECFVPPVLRMQTLSTGDSRDVFLKKSTVEDDGCHYKVIIGSEQNRKTILSRLQVVFQPLVSGSCVALIRSYLAGLDIDRPNANDE